MVMPPENLHHPRANVDRAKNMLEVSMMKTRRTDPPVPAAASTSVREYGEYETNLISSSKSTNSQCNHNCSSAMNNSGNDHSTKTIIENKDCPIKLQHNFTTPDFTSSSSNINENQCKSNNTDDGKQYMNENKNECIHHRELNTTAIAKNTTGVHYPARPSREDVLQRLSEALLRRSLQKIDLSQRSLQASDAKLVKMALAQNANLTVLKLGYNNLGDAGVTTLAAGIVAHRSLNLLDLGFNNIGDEGVRALAHSLQEASEQRRPSQRNGGYNTNGSGCDVHGISTLHTLYLAGNLIGEDGAISIADFLRRGSRLRKLFMTGNRIGGEGVKAITDAILEQQETINQATSSCQIYDNSSSVEFRRGINLEIPTTEVIDSDDYGKQTTTSTGTPSLPLTPPSIGPADAKDKTKSNFQGMQELYLGGTGMKLIGCQALSRLLEKSSSLRLLSLPNCDIGDEEIRMLALSMKSNKDRLPIESLQLSFNNISHKGFEAMANALWGSTTLRELKVDNNIIGDRGAHQMAAIIPALKIIEVIDVGFNSITAPGLTVLMKTVSESKKLLSLSLSGNAIDINSAKSVAYALAYNCSLESLFLVHCSIGHEEQRHITAGIVSNSRTALDRLNGFEIGPILLTLGFPEALKNWTNEQVFHFIHLMWQKNDENEDLHLDLERDLDPLSFLSNPKNCKKGISSSRQSGPLEASVVVEVAERFLAGLVANGIDIVSRRGADSNHLSIGSPLTDVIITESSPSGTLPNPMMYMDAHSFNSQHDLEEKIRTAQVRSFVAPPESPAKKKQEMQDPNRKKRIVEWLCLNVRLLNELVQIPFNSRELWKLHQFYFTPVVKESGGSSSRQKAESNLISSSVPEVQIMNQSRSTFMTQTTQSIDNRPSVPVSDPAFSGPSSSSTLLKRKVSYRCLGDAISITGSQTDTSAIDNNSVAKIIENGHTGHSLRPKTKKARRNRTRISFLPRIKSKLDSYLDVDHEKALVIMRQLYFVEQAILSGKIIPIEADSTPRSHLSGTLAIEAEMIIVDMM